LIGSLHEQGSVLEVDESVPAHNLDVLAEEVRREYFPSHPALPIRWGIRVNRKKRTSIRLGSYDHRTTEIRIHPALDSEKVPRFFIHSVIYHEYLHHILGPQHNRRFHQHESRFQYQKEARDWLKRNLVVLLGIKSRPTPPPAARPAAPPHQLSLF